MLLVGEGTDDIGDSGSYHPRKGARPGVLDTLARLVAGDDLLLEFRKERFSAFAKSEILEADHHVERAAAAALALALFHGARVLLFSHDCDGESPDQLAAHAQLGFEKYLEAHPEAADIIRVVAFPRRMVEAWLLSQPEAFVRAFGKQKDRAFRFPRHPESLHGQKADAEGNYPKQVFRRALKAFARENGSEARAAVAAEIDVNADLSSVPTLAAFVQSAGAQASRCRTGA